MTKRIALFTTFYEAESGFSLITVAETQIRMLLDHGYDPLVLVQGQYSENKDGEVTILPFKEVAPPSVWNRQAVDLRPVIPPLKLTDGVARDFEQQVQRIVAALEENLADVDVCITHGIILLDSYKEHNVAMRRYAKTRPDLLWLHWIHSCPTPKGLADYPRNCRYTPPPGYIIYPNSSDLGRVCQTYRLGGKEWRARACRAGHAIDPLSVLPYHELTKALVTYTDLLGGDVTAIYPRAVDRGKKPDKVIRLMAGVMKLGYEPRLLIVDWQSQGEHFQAYMDELIELTQSLGLEGRVHFTSRLDDRCSQGVPRQVVLELMGLTNVYIHSSAVETYSLVVHEAALRGNLLVLNHDFPAMRELYGDAAIYFDFGSDRNPRTYTPNEQTFWDDEAVRLVAELNQNRALTAKTQAQREWTPRALWKEFVPLLGLEPVAGAGQWGPEHA